jgi:uncharacterized protein
MASQANKVTSFDVKGYIVHYVKLKDRKNEAEVIIMIKKHPLAYYFLFTFLLSWAFWTIPIFLSLGVYKNNVLSSAFGLGVISPIVISVLLSLKAFGGKGIRDLISRFGLKGIHFRWYLIAAFSLIVVSITTLLIYFLLEGTPEKTFQYYSFNNYVSMMPVFLIFATLEEVGWRGFALPGLRKTLNALPASIMLGVIWSVWHFPKLICEGTVDINSFFVIVFFGILFSLFLSWIYENSNGSITLSILAHAAGNAAIYAINPEVLTKIGYNKPSIIYVIIFFLFIISVVLFYGINLRRSQKIGVFGRSVTIYYHPSSLQRFY